jgi:signal transduction histidine kinase
LPDDELGRLANAFDSLIERLDPAFQRQQRFTADAAHELRTPLAIVCAEADAARRRPREPLADNRVLEKSTRRGRGCVSSSKAY